MGQETFAISCCAGTEPVLGLVDCHTMRLLSEILTLADVDAGPSRADSESRWGNKFVASSSGGGFQDRERSGGFGDRERGGGFDRSSSRGEGGDTWGRRPSEGEPPAAGGEVTAAAGDTASGIGIDEHQPLTAFQAISPCMSDTHSAAGFANCEGQH